MIIEGKYFYCSQGFFNLSFRCSRWGKERERREKEMDELKPLIDILEKRLANKEFTSNAPKEIVQKERS